MTANWRCRHASRRSGKIGSRLVISVTADPACRSGWAVMVVATRRCVSAGLAQEQKGVSIARLPGEAVAGALVRREKKRARQTDCGTRQHVVDARQRAQPARFADDNVDERGIDVTVVRDVAFRPPFGQSDNGRSRLNYDGNNYDGNPSI